MARKWWTLTLVCVAAFMLLLDVTIVNVAVPEIQSDLGASLSSLQQVIAIDWFGRAKGAAEGMPALVGSP